MPVAVEHMTIFDEGRQLRFEAAKLRPDRRRRYSNELRRRLVDWLDRAVAAGLTEADCSKLVGIKTWRFRCWRATPRLTTTSEEREPLALVPIAVTTAAASAGLSLVAPSGHRIEGLTIEQVVALLRELV
jgi:hypothetical protein